MSEFSMKGAGLNSPLTSMIRERMMGEQPSPAVGSQEPEKSSGQKSFSETLLSMIQDVNQVQKDADKASQEFAKGKGSLHGVMIAVEKADISLRALNSVRGKLIEAYQEVMKMPV